MRSKSSNHKGFIVLMGFTWLYVFILLLSVSLPYNPLEKPLVKKSYLIKLFVPEGWGFFTKNPRENRMYFLVDINGKLIQDPRLRNATLRNLFGLKRDGRVLNLVYANKILNKKYHWYKYIDNSSKVNYYSNHYMSNSVVIDSVPGVSCYHKVIIISKKIIPWAYNNFEGKIGQEISFVKLDVKYK